MIREFLENHGDYRDDKYFKDITTLKLGGKICHYVEPYSTDDLMVIINYLITNKVPYKIIGNGSNLVCGSDTFDGVVIKLKHFDNYEVKNNELYVEAGVMAPYLANVMASENLSGLEFASGIPGTIGGLIFMNAGAYKKSMSDIVLEVLVLKNNELVWMKNNELKFNYRYSIFQEHPHWSIVACKLKLNEGKEAEIRDLMVDRLERRKKTQPLDLPSAGSSFRNPDTKPAWKLIDDIGYRGYKVNGIEVSNKHSNFIVNTGNGKGEDYLKIAYEIIEKVDKKHHIKLVMEVEKFNC